MKHTIFESLFAHLGEKEGYTRADLVRLLNTPADLKWLGFTPDTYPDLDTEIRRELEILTER